MAGATLSTTLRPISNPMNIFGERNDIESIRMEEERQSMVADEAVNAVPDAMEPASSRTSDEGSLFCSHCDFTSESTSEMTRHRWEVHPLETRRKKHLMTSSKVSRKRPNSESSEDRKSPDNEAVAPNKRQTGRDDIAMQSWQSDLVTNTRPCSHVRRTCSAEELLDKSHAATTSAKSIQSKKSSSLGDLSTIKPDSTTDNNPASDVNGSSRSARLSIIDGMAAAYYGQHVVDCITKQILMGSRQSSDSATDDATHASKRQFTLARPKTQADTVTRETTPPSQANSRGDLDTLAKAALSSRPVAFPPMHSALLTKSNDSEVPATSNYPPTSARAAQLWPNFHTANGYGGMYTSGDKLSQGFVTTLDKRMRPFEVANIHPSIFPYGPAGLMPPNISGFYPDGSTHQANAKNVFLGNNVFLNPNPILTAMGHAPGYPIPLYSGLNIPMQPQATTEKAHSAVARLNGEPQHNKLSALSDVASKLLNDDTMRTTNGFGNSNSSHHLKEEVSVFGRYRDQEPSNRLETKQSQPVQLTAPNKGIRDHQTVQRCLPAKFDVPPSSRSILSHGQSQSEGSAGRNSSIPFKHSHVVPNNDVNKPSRSDVTQLLHPATQRSLMQPQPMDDDRVRSIEEALRKTDCCDPNERSNVLPFRCPDGKWKMVRTKRIAGAWLVQMPGKDAPSVYLPNTDKRENSGESLNDLLKAKLNSINNSVQRNQEAFMKKPNCGMNIQKQASRPSEYYSGTKPHNYGIARPERQSVGGVVQNDAIRNLLLQKTALA